MSEPSPVQNPATSTRREFLKTGTAIVGTSVIAPLGLASSVFAAGSDRLRVGLVGCGGRGTGAARQALDADPQVELHAMGDAFSDRLESSLKELSATPVASKINVTPERMFVGFDAYRDVLASGVDVIILATPPHFRPEHLRAAVDARVHAFVEKPVAVDAPGVRSVIESCKQAEQKNLSVVSGLCWRYDPGMRATFDQIHDGTIGDIVSMRCSYNTRGLWSKPRQSQWSDMEWQLRNWLYFTWLSGDHISEQHIHSLDKMAWALGDRYPIQASGTGGRQVRTSPEFGHIFDHFAVEYEYGNGLRGFSRCRQQDGCDVDVNDSIVGTKGYVDVMKNTVYDHAGKRLWRYRGEKANMYQVEHNELFASIRAGQPINNGEYMANSTLMAILGRMAAYSGKDVTWDEAMQSEERLGPSEYTWGSLPIPPVPMPGIV